MSAAGVRVESRAGGRDFIFFVKEHVKELVRGDKGIVEVGKRDIVHIILHGVRLCGRRLAQSEQG